MESGAQPVRRLESLRKRTLEDRKSSGGEEFVLPPKQRECNEEKEDFASRARSATRCINFVLENRSEKNRQCHCVYVVGM